jgi:hypothetical protein
LPSVAWAGPGRTIERDLQDSSSPPSFSTADSPWVGPEPAESGTGAARPEMSGGMSPTRLRGGSGLALGAVLFLSLLFFPGPGVCQTVEEAGRESGSHRVHPIDPETAPRPVARATRTVLPVVVDGVLDEEAWEAAEVITGFIQSQPDAGYPASEETLVRVLFDDRFLYVGALLLDSEPGQIVAQYLNQDYETHDDDTFSVTLDTFLDRRNSFMFLVNPNGAVKDGQTFDNSRTTNLAWEGVIQVRTSIHELGWTVELAIPFTTLRYDPEKGEQAWGVNFLRRLRRRNEDSYWAPMDRRFRVHSMAVAGTLTGLTGLPRNRNLSLKPFLLADNTSGDLVPPGSSGAAYDAGLDLKYGVTPRLTLDLTYRTDFSQVEVDQEQVNLTRFSLFFPEKRDFFMENSGIYAFGDQSERNYRLGASPRDFTLFHSRRIGLHQGRPVPILAGGRLSGRTGAFDVGLLHMRTESTDSLPSQSFSVARVRRTFGNVLQVGALVAGRDNLGEEASGYNRSYGLDANLSLGDKFLAHSYLALTDYPGRAGNNRAARVSAAFRDRLWDVSALVREVGDAFRPGMGFVARSGMRHSYGTVGIHPRPALPWVSDVNPYVEMDYITNLESSLETRNLSAGLGVAFQDGGQLNATASDRVEVLKDAFVVAGQGEVALGRYAFREASVAYTSSAARHISGQAGLSGGGYYNGHRRSLTLGGSWRPSRHFAVDLRAQRNEIFLPGNEFSADVFGARLDLAGSTRFFVSAFLQYNSASDEVVSNVRLNFIHSPLSDLFLVYSERRDVEDDLLLERSLAIKVTKLLSF